MSVERPERGVTKLRTDDRALPIRIAQSAWAVDGIITTQAQFWTWLDERNRISAAISKESHFMI